jgi:glutamate/tyrosine decarboxylase-like PLP-dependent enzyme
MVQLRDTFLILPEYLKDTHQYSAEFNFTDHGLQLTRGFRALKLWMSIKVFGMAAFRAAVEHGFALITSTVLQGRTVLRTCTINPRTTEADIEETLDRLDRLARG